MTKSYPLAEWLVRDLRRAEDRAARIVCGACQRPLTLAEAIEATRAMACPHCGHWPADATAHRSLDKFEVGPDGWPRVVR